MNPATPNLTSDPAPVPPSEVGEVDPERQLATAVGALTAASGMALIVAPKLMLRILGAGRDHPAPFLFRVVGMFMTMSGASLLDTVRSANPSPRALRWAAMTKLGATVMVVGGVRRRRLNRLGFGLAIFDGVAAVLLARLARRAR